MIKAASVAVMALWAVMKAGPVGKLTAIIGVVGDLVKDYQNYQWNKEHPDDQVGVAFEGIWKTLDDNGLSSAEKAFEIGSKIIGALVDGLTQFLDDHGDQIITMVEGVFDWLTNALDMAFEAGTGALSQTSKAGKLIKKMGEFLGKLLEASFQGINNIGGVISTGIVSMMDALDG